MTVWFVGAGPGAPDLLTLRAVRVLGEADIVIWARSLVDPAVLEYARPDAEQIASDNKTFDDVLAIYRRAAARGAQRRPRALRRPDALRHAARATRRVPRARPGVRDRARRLLARRSRGLAGAGADGARRVAVADPHASRPADVDAAERGPARHGRPRHDDGALPLRAPPARAAGRPARGRLRAGDAVRGRLPRELAGRDRHPLRSCPRSATRSAPRKHHHPGARAPRPRARRGGRRPRPRLRPWLRPPLPPARPPRPLQAP